MYKPWCFTGCKDNWDERVWEDHLLQFLSETLTEVDEEKWSVGLGVKLMEQSSLYQSYPEERGMLFKCLAVTVCHTTDTQFISQQLDVILSSMRQNSTNESKVSDLDILYYYDMHLFHKLTGKHVMFKSQIMLYRLYMLFSTCGIS